MDADKIINKVYAKAKETNEKYKDDKHRYHMLYTGSIIMGLEIALRNVIQDQRMKMIDLEIELKKGA